MNSQVRLQRSRVSTQTLTSSMTSTLERLRIALAMQRSCFSLGCVDMSCGVGILAPQVAYAPSRKIITTFGNRGIEVPEHVDVDHFRRLFRNIFRGYQMHTTECFKLRERCSTLCHERRLPHATHNVGVFIFVENVEGRPQCSTQNRRVLCPKSQL